MALRGTLTHWKTRLLSEELKIDPAFALGILEALWHVTAKDTPTGCIGHLSNHGIAMRVFSHIDPDALIAALLKSGHLETHPEHRLIVHDWSEHSDDAVDNRLARHGLHYADGKQPRMRRMRQEERERLCEKYGFLMNFVRTEHHGAPQDTTEHHKSALTRSQRPEARGQKPVRTVESTEALENAGTVEQSSSSSANGKRGTIAAKYRESLKVARGHFAAAADEDTVAAILRASLESVPSVSDLELATALARTYRKGYQKSPMLWAKTVPSWLDANRKKADESPEYHCQTCEDHERVFRRGLDVSNNSWMDLPPSEIYEPCPDCQGKRHTSDGAADDQGRLKKPPTQSRPISAPRTMKSTEVNQNTPKKGT